MASAMEKDRRLKPVPFAEFGKIQPGTNGSARFIGELNQRSEQTRQLVGARDSGVSPCEFFVVAS